MKYFLIAIIKLYQRVPGKFHELCRHYPTCSSYFIEALEVHGFFKGSYLGMKRIFRCNPWGTYGYDPVPKKEKL